MKKINKEPLQSAKDVFNAKLTPTGVVAVLALVFVMLVSIQRDKSTLKKEMLEACKPKDLSLKENFTARFDPCPSAQNKYWDAPGID